MAASLQAPLNASLLPDCPQISLSRLLLKHAFGVPLKHPIAPYPHQLLPKQGIHSFPRHLRPKRMPKPMRIEFTPL